MFLQTHEGPLRLQVLLAIFVSAFLVAALYFGTLYEVQSDLFDVLSLGFENNFAAWFSGTLLMLVAFHALDGRTLYQDETPDLSRAWSIIACVFVFLSADEVASLHERMAILGERWGLGAWALILPLGAVIAGFLSWALLKLWSAGGLARRQTVLLIIGFGFFASVVLQEFIEHAFVWDTAQARALRVSIEEGGELIGMIVLLTAAIGNTRALLQNRVPGRTVFRSLTTNDSLVAVVLMTAPLVAFVTSTLGDAHRGRPADWMAAMLFLASAAVVLSGWLQGTQTQSPLKLIAALLTVSCVCVAVSPGYTLDLGLTVISLKSLVLFGLTWVLLLFLAHMRGDSVSWPLLLAFGAVGLILLVFSGKSVAAFGLQIAFGTLLYWKTVASSRQDVRDIVAANLRPMRAHARTNFG